MVLKEIVKIGVDVTDYPQIIGKATTFAAFLLLGRKGREEINGYSGRRFQRGNKVKIHENASIAGNVDMDLRIHFQWPFLFDGDQKYRCIDGLLLKS